jgi:hypothetical protein
VLASSEERVYWFEVREVRGRDRNSLHVAGSKLLYARGPLTVVAFSEHPRAIFVEVTHHGQIAPIVVRIREGVILAPDTEANDADSNSPLHRTSLAGWSLPDYVGWSAPPVCAAGSLASSSVRSSLKDSVAR